MTDPSKREFDMSDTQLTKRAKASAAENGHLVKRPVTKKADQIVGLDDSGKANVLDDEYVRIDNVGEYNCTCGWTGDGAEAAANHLHDAANGMLEDPRDE